MVIAASSGYVKVHMTTAKIIAEELADILDDYRKDKRNGVVPMSTRAISKMLLKDED